MSRIPSATLWTIGHSVRQWEEFAGMLVAARIEALVDVRRFAGSRRNPQFSGEAMGPALAEHSIAYVPMPDLGVRRPTRADSPNLAWRNASFRGYADYMATLPYRMARERLAQLAQSRRTAVMCAEAMWWQCHRSLISDDFKAGGWEVIHLASPGREQEHPYTSAARIVEGRLDYTLPADPQASLFP
ncbi:MAG: DUF488 family protein [Pseudoxanthomonas sp.]